jgi:hypothetical protein
MADALLTIARLRRLEVNEARRDLAACLAGEAEAATALRSAEAELAEEARVACALPGAFGAWAPSGLQAIRRCRDALARAGALRAAAALHLAARKAALKAVETRLEARRTEARRQEARRREAVLADSYQAAARRGGDGTGR